MAAKPVCLICLQKFNYGGRNDRSGSNLNCNNLSENFINFLQHHLQIHPSSLELLHQHHSSKSSPSFPLFCDECKVVISAICKLYKELVDIQNKLRDRLGKLEEIIGDSLKGAGGDKGENLLFSWVISQLKGFQKSSTGKRQIVELRLLLSHYCKLESLKHVSIQEVEKEQDLPKNKTDSPKTPARVTRQVAKNLHVPSPSPSPPINPDDNIIIKEELPDPLEIGDEAEHNDNDNSRDYSDPGTGGDSDGAQDNDWIEANDDNDQDDKPSSSDDDEDNFSEEPSDSDDDWNGSSSKRKSNGRSITTRTTPTSRKTPVRPSTASKKSDNPRKMHKRLVADKLNLYPDTIWSCDYCTSTLKSGNSLLTHLTYRHERSITSRTFPCYLCSRTFGFPQTRSIHLKLFHWKEQPLTFTCTPNASPLEPPPCGAPSFTDPSSLLTHLQSDHPSQPLHTCTTCQWPFLSSNTQILHELLHTPLPPGGQGYPCPYSGCDHHAGHIKHLVRHYSSKHDINEESFKCKICLKGFSNQATLNSHQRLHTIEEKLGSGDLAPDFKCGKCGKWHGNERSLELHVNRKHTLQKCPDCGVEKYYDAYRKHLLVKHGIGKGRSVVCDKCGKECATRYVLRKHLEMKHHPEGKNRPREWVCEECGKSYHGKVALKVHEVTKHMGREEREGLPVEVGKGRWKSKCLRCGKIFKAESDVLAHLYFMEKSCRARREKNGEGEKREVEEEMEEVKEWFGGDEGEGNGDGGSFGGGDRFLMN